MNTNLQGDLIEKLAGADRFAVEQLADFGGPSVFNPMIGRTPTETFGNLEKVLGFATDLLEKDFAPVLGMDGMALLVHTAWAAAQYEAFRAKEAEVSE